MYDLAMQAFRRTVDVPDQRLLGHHLESLQPAVRQLRARYRSAHVLVDYRHTASAYLLAYVPAYIRMAERVLVRVLKGAAIGPTLRVGIVGAGPAPEAVALVNYLRRAPRLCEHLDIHLFDVATGAWGPVRTALVDVGCRARWPGTIDVAHHDLDLARPSGVAAHRNVFASLDLIVVQNCLNEDIARRPAGMENLRELLSLLKPGASMAIADQHNYEAVRESLRLLADELEGELTVRSRFADIVRSPVTDLLPPLLTSHLLTGADGLIPRTRLEFGVLAVGRSASPPAAAHQVPSPPQPPPMRRPVRATAPQVPRPGLPPHRRPPELSLAEIRKMFFIQDTNALTGVRRTLDEYRAKQRPVTGVVARVERGHLVVDVAGIHVSVSAASIEFAHTPRDLSPYLGRRLSLMLEVVSASHVRGNRRAYLARRRHQLVNEVAVGSRLSGFIRELQPKAAVVDVDGLDVVVPMSELSHEWINAVEDAVEVGQEVEVRITEVDRLRVRLLGSIARCTPDLLAEFDSTHRSGELVAGEVAGLEAQWAEVLVAGLIGRVHISKIAFDRISHPSDRLQIGQEIWAVYLGVSKGRRDRHLRLSITDMHSASPVAPDFRELWTD